MIGKVKKSLYNTIGKTILTWSELEVVLLDVESILINRPLSYVEDDVQIYESTMILEDDPGNTIGKGRRKRAQFIKKCEEAIWSRWRHEYLTASRERHKVIYGKEQQFKVGDVVIIKENERNRALRKLGIAEKLIRGKNGVVRAVQLWTGKSYLERAVRYLHPLELQCDRKDNPVSVEERSYKTERLLFPISQ